MDQSFKLFVDRLHPKCEELLSMKPVNIQTLPKSTPVGGIYLFSDGNNHLYTGRTKRPLHVRIKSHVSTAKDCPFAWHIAREQNGFLATYKKLGSRNHLLGQPSFAQVYAQAKDYIRTLDVRFVGESDPLCQALLEMYVAVVTKAKYNDFDTH